MAKTKEKDINIRIRQSTNKRLKIKAARLGLTVKDLIDKHSKTELDSPFQCYDPACKYNTLT